MKLVRFRYNGDLRAGALLEGEVVDLQAAFACYLMEVQGDQQALRVAAVRIPENLLTLMRAGETSLVPCRKALAFARETGRATGLYGKRLRYLLDEVELVLPYRPETALFAGPNADPKYADRLKPHLEFYLKSQHAFVGPEAAVHYQPDCSTRFGVEAELGVIIGKPGRYISPEHVADHIMGYTLVADITARDALQVGWEGSMWHMRYAEGASFDTAAVLGPAIVTADEVGAVEELKATFTRNGQVIQEYSLGELRHTVDQFVSYCSTFFTLEPGLLISMGAVGGSYLTINSEGNPIMVERESELGQYLAPEDELLVEIAEIGKLSVTVVEVVPEDESGKEVS